jgi:hypothetical protein
MEKVGHIQALQDWSRSCLWPAPTAVGSVHAALNIPPDTSHTLDTSSLSPLPLTALSGPWCSLEGSPTPETDLLLGTLYPRCDVAKHFLCLCYLWLQ